MVDTPRTQAQLLTASADNTSGAWTNQNERDFIVSVFGMRTVSGTSDTPSGADGSGRFIAFTSASSITLTANDLGAGQTYSVQQQGAGQITVVAGAGVTLVSDKSSASFTSARAGAVLTVIGTGTATVFVIGNTA